MLTTKPKFKYVVVLKANQPEHYTNQNNNYKKPVAPANEQVVCFSDGFEIKEDGSIVFYQIVRMDSREEKQVKVPVLAYPSGKWENCLLLSSDNSLVAFSADSVLDIKNNTYSESQSSANYGGLPVRPPSPSPFNGQNDSFAPPNTGFKPPQEEDFSIPGFSAQQTQDFQKIKREYTEAELRKYLIDNDKFTLVDFQKHLEIANKKRPTNPKIVLSENDIQFNVSSLLRKNIFPPQKFLDSKAKHILDMYLPPILKRQWEGKTAPIMETLQGSNDTQTITQIDLSAWLALKGYFRK